MAIYPQFLKINAKNGFNTFKKAILFICIIGLSYCLKSFGQLSAQKWEISAGQGFHSLTMTSVNNTFLNFTNVKLINPNIPIKRGQITDITVSKRINGLWKIGISLSALNNFGDQMLYQYKGIVKKDTSVYIGSNYIGATAFILSIKPSLSLNHLFRLDSTNFGRRFRASVKGELGYGLSNLTMDFSQFSDSIRVLHPYKNVNVWGNGLDLASSIVLDFIMLDGEKASLLGTVEGGIQYHKTGLLTGDGANQWPGLNLDFSGSYILFSLKLAFGRR